MKNRFNLLIIFILLSLFTNSIFAQLVFPNGHEKRMTTTLSLLYEETKIPFVYHGGKVIDLGYRRLSDSIPPDWFVMACMNGTCIGGVPETGEFENLGSAPDSIGFVKYHMDFKDVPGTAIIRFVIFKELLMGGAIDTVTFNITHVTNNAVRNSSFVSNLSVYPNPATSFWNVNGTSKSALQSYTLTDVLGNILIAENPFTSANIISIHLDNSNLLPGIYYLKLNTGDGTQSIPLIKN